MKTGWRGDLAVVLAIVLLAVLTFALRSCDTASAASVVIEMPTGERILPLSADTTLTLEGRDGHTVTVEIASGAVRVAEADCPDQVCVRSGWLSRPGACAACVPAGITLRVSGDETEVDAVAR